MTAFIRQEAMEKANEIRLKADEEFAIEKSKLVRQETASIDTSYEKKFKQASMSQQITRSTVSNKSRLRILSARQELLNRLFEDANKKLGSVSKDKKKYQDVLKNLILEGAYALNEDKLQVKVRKADNDIAKKAIDEAQSEYKSKVGKEVAITIDESDPLPEGS
jgi:V-type H+-transporting ATPase subunit E